MPVIQRADEADFTFRIEDCEDELRVIRFQGEERISRPFRFVVDLAVEDPELGFEDMLMKPALLTVRGEQAERYVHGVILRFSQTGGGDRFATYRAEVVPSMFLLALRVRHRIFQERTVQDIIMTVLDEAGLAADRYRFSLQGEHPERVYCVQYGESDLDFIMRLMEEEGIFFFFEHTEEGHVLIMADDAGVHGDIEGELPVIFREPSGMAPEQESVHACRLGERIRTGSVVLRDFNHENPGLNLEVEEQAEKDSALCWYDYPGNYDAAGVGTQWAGFRLEAFTAARVTLEGEGNCRRFLPGFLFDLDEHPAGGFNRQYLLTGVSHQGEQPGSLAEEAGTATLVYRNAFVCIPSSVPYRPPRTTLKPKIFGKQTARVVGPSGEEIYTDDQGRVKVQFHWDREGQLDESSSCWVRVSEGFAGGGYGTLFLPRIGQEVVVSFLEGDPDRPVITGRVYNGDHPVPYDLPGERTKSVIRTKSYKGEGANEIRLEDNAGAEQFYLHAQRDMDTRVLNDLKETVDRDAHLLVKGASKERLGSQSLTVEEDDTVKVEGTLSLTVEKNVLEDFQQSWKEEVASEYYLKAKSVYVEAAREASLDGPGGFVKLDASGVTIQGTKVLINSGGSPTSPSVSADPAVPALPGVVATTLSGQDTIYAPVSPVRAEQVVPPPMVFQEPEPEEEEEAADEPEILNASWRTTNVKCGDEARMTATTRNIPAGTSAVFTLKRVADDGTVTTVARNTEATSVEATWASQKTSDTWNSDGSPLPEVKFTVAAGGVQTDSEGDQLSFHRYPDHPISDYTAAMRSTVQVNRRTITYGWDRRVSVEFTDRVMTIHVPIKVSKRSVGRPERRKGESYGDWVRRCNREPLAGDGNLSGAERNALKRAIEAYFHRKKGLHRAACSRHAGEGGCPDSVTRKCCKFEIRVRVHFYDIGSTVSASEVNYWNGSGRADAANWFSADNPSRMGVFAHEVGHLLGFYDEYQPDGATGPAPWLRTNRGALMCDLGARLENYYFDVYGEWLGESGRTGETWAVVPYA